jgi:PAS domain-containing protein
VSDTIARAVFGLMFETSTEAVFIVENARGRIVSANVRVAELLATDVGQVVGKTFDEIAFEPRDVSLDGR